MRSFGSQLIVIRHSLPAVVGRIRRLADQLMGEAKLPSPNSVSSRSPFTNMETDLSFWRSWRKHQLADGVEDDLKLGVVFVFERGELAGQFRVREKHLAQAHKCAHDGDVDSRSPDRSVASPCDQCSPSNGVPARRIDLHGSRTPQDAGEHRDALLGKGVGKITAATATAL
jgi:hypothetical protein